MRRNLNGLALAISLTLILSVRARGAGSLHDQEVRQQQIQASVQRISNNLDELAKEFQRNGIGGDDLEAVRDIQCVLGKLTAGEMDQIVALLRDAQRTTDGSAAKADLAGVAAAQKAVVTRLRELLAKYRRAPAAVTASDAGKRIEQIRRQVADALQRMLQQAGENGPSGAGVRAAADAFAAAANAVGAVATAASGASLSPMLPSVLDQAQQQLGDAAARVASNDPSRAAASGDRAQDLLARAQVLLGQAAASGTPEQAGLSGSGANPRFGGRPAAPGAKPSAGHPSQEPDADVPAIVPSDDLGRGDAFTATHEDRGVVAWQPAPESVPTGFESRVDEYFKDLSDGATGSAPRAGR